MPIVERKARRAFSGLGRTKTESAGSVSLAARSAFHRLKISSAGGFQPCVADSNPKPPVPRSCRSMIPRELLSAPLDSVLARALHLKERWSVRPARPSLVGQGGLEMRYLKYAGLLGLFMVLAGTAHAQGRVQFGVGVGVGPGPGYGAVYGQDYGYDVGPAPVCPYGYYNYYPYDCVPYGYYGPEYFSGGGFIGAGPRCVGGD